MIPYPYNMVDMGGIDLAEANGTVVEGLYNKIIEAANACGDLVFYNWKFAGIEIAPQHTTVLLGDPIIINGAVQVTEQDEVTVPGINPDPPAPPTIIPLTVSENGTFSPPSGVAGYAPVTVDVTGDSVTQIMEQGQVSTTSAYATAYYASGIDPTQYDGLIVTLWKFGNQIGSSGFAPVMSGQKIRGRDNLDYIFTTTAEGISCTQYSGNYFDLFVNVYGVSLQSS